MWEKKGGNQNFSKILGGNQSLTHYAIMIYLDKIPAFDTIDQNNIVEILEAEIVKDYGYRNGLKSGFRKFLALCGI